MCVTGRGGYCCLIRSPKLLILPLFSFCMRCSLNFSETLLRFCFSCAVCQFSFPLSCLPSLPLPLLCLLGPYSRPSIPVFPAPSCWCFFHILQMPFFPPNSSLFQALIDFLCPPTPSRAQCVLGGDSLPNLSVYNSSLSLFFLNPAVSFSYPPTGQESSSIRYALHRALIHTHTHTRRGVKQWQTPTCAVIGLRSGELA